MMSLGKKMILVLMLFFGVMLNGWASETDGVTVGNYKKSCIECRKDFGKKYSGLSTIDDSVSTSSLENGDQVFQEKPEAVDSGIDFFNGSWEDLLSKAKVENKNIFVDVYTEWCGPCKIMSSEVFPDREVGQYYNEKFINFKLDAEDESVNGPALAEKYRVDSYPTLLYLQPNGEEIGRASSMNKEEFLEFAAHLLGEKISDIGELLKRYDEGDRDDSFVRRLISRIRVEEAVSGYGNKGELANKRYKIVEEYVHSKPLIEMINKDDFSILSHYLHHKPRGDEWVEFIVEHYDDFRSVALESELTGFVLDATWYAVLDLAESGDKIYLKYIKDLEESPLKFSANSERKRRPHAAALPENLRPLAEDLFLKATGQWDKLYNKVVKSVRTNPSTKNYSRAVRVMSEYPEGKYINEAVKYAAKNFELNPDPDTAFDYAGVLKLAGKDEQAKVLLSKYRSGIDDTPSGQADKILFDRMTQSRFAPMVINGVFTVTDQMLEIGVDPNTVEARIWRMKEPDSASKGLVDVIKKISVVNGEFQFYLPVMEVERLGLSIESNNDSIPLGWRYVILEPGAEITVDMNGQTIKAKNSPLYDQLSEYETDKSYKTLTKEMEDLTSKLNQKISVSEQESLLERYYNLDSKREEVKSKYLQELTNSGNPLLRFLALSDSSHAVPLGEKLNGLEKLKEELPDYRPLVSEITQVKERIRMDDRDSALVIGAEVESFEAKNIEGKRYDVNDILAENQYVLVEFWASWCGPCRAEIPHMKSVYDAYSNKGFEIVSFSLDHIRENWADASMEEVIPWIDLSDLMAFDSPVIKAYGITAVPANYLLDSKGRIVAKNLRQKELDDKLSELLND